MTSWQDQPPQTRRQARESQRAAEHEHETSGAEPAAGSRRAATYAPIQGGEVPEVSTPYSFASSQRDASAPTAQNPAPAAPMRPRAPRYDDLAFDSLLAASHAGGPTNAAPGQDRLPAPVAYAPVPSQPAPARQEPADYTSPVAYTPPQPTPPSQPSTPPQSAQPVPVQRAVPSVPAEDRPLTRRELRAMMQAQRPAEEAQESALAPAMPLPFATTRPESQPQWPTPVAPAEPTSSAADVQRAAPAPAAVSRPVPLPAASDAPEPPRPAYPTPSAAAPASRFADLISGNIPVVAADAATSFEAPVPTPRRAPEQVLPAEVPAVAQQPTPERTIPVAHAAPAPVAPTTGETNTGPATDPQLRARAAGHWSTMNGDNAAPGDPVSARSTASTGSVTTANALILPTSPVAGLGTSPLTSTGEVIVTGSIDLPRSLGATGQHPDHFDSSDIDKLFDETDAAPASSSVAPVRASRAVATHTSTRGMITPPTKRGNKLPVALAVTAAFLAIGVAALLVAGYVFHAF